MPVSYPVSLPVKPAPQSITISKNSVVASTPSPFTFSDYIQVWSGQRWTATIQLPPMLRAGAELWVAALTSLNFKEGSMLLGDTANLSPRGIGTGTPLVNGGSQTGYDLITDGWTASKTGIMLRGDWVQLGTGSTSRLYKVMVDANSNGSGQATLTLWPQLRSSPADNDPLTIHSPMGKFMLATEPAWAIAVDHSYGMSFDAVEDLRP